MNKGDYYEVAYSAARQRNEAAIVQIAEEANAEEFPEGAWSEIASAINDAFKEQ